MSFWRRSKILFDKYFFNDFFFGLLYVFPMYSKLVSNFMEEYGGEFELVVLYLYLNRMNVESFQLKLLIDF